MTDILCGYTGDREAMLMAYLYDEIAPEDREPFDAHLATCARCRVELTGLRDVRTQLAGWAPPEFSNSRQLAVERTDSLNGRQSAVGRPQLLNSRQSAVGSLSSAADSRQTAAGRRARWPDIPAWAQVAAAMLVVGASAGIANLDVHYDAQNGLNVRTGWSRTTNATAVASPSNAANVTPSGSAPWRADLASLERQLRSEFRASSASASTAAAPAAAATLARSGTGADADVMRRIKSLVDESERRQQRELALRVAELLRDLNVQRQADLRKIDQNLGLMQERTGVEVLRNRQMIDYYMQRVSQRQ